MNPEPNDSSFELTVKYIELNRPFSLIQNTGTGSLPLYIYVKDFLLLLLS